MPWFVLIWESFYPHSGEGTRPESRPEAPCAHFTLLFCDQWQKRWTGFNYVSPQNAVSLYKGMARKVLSPWRSARQKQMSYLGKKKGPYSPQEAHEATLPGTSAPAEPQGNRGSSCGYQTSRWANREMFGGHTLSRLCTLSWKRRIKCWCDRTSFSLVFSNTEQASACRTEWLAFLKASGRTAQVRTSASAPSLQSSLNKYR